MDYIPHPTDLTGVELDAALKDDLETAARDIHETWALQRVRAGWRYGDAYDRVQKAHPCLVPYDDLPESEKDVDRATVTQTVKMLLKMGYTIEKTAAPYKGGISDHENQGCAGGRADG